MAGIGSLTIAPGDRYAAAGAGRPFLYPVIAEIVDIHISRRIYKDPNGIGELIGLRPLSIATGDGLSGDPAGRPFLNPVIQPVYDIDISRGVDENGDRIIQLTGGYTPAICRSYRHPCSAGRDGLRRLYLATTVVPGYGRKRNTDPRTYIQRATQTIAAFAVQRNSKRALAGGPQRGHSHSAGK